MNNKNFDKCEHNFKFDVDASESGGPGNKPWKSFYICEECKNSITLSEKIALDSAMAQRESLKIQEKNTKRAMWANIISASAIAVTIFVFLVSYLIK